MGRQEDAGAWVQQEDAEAWVSRRRVVELGRGEYKDEGWGEGWGED